MKPKHKARISQARVELEDGKRELLDKYLSKIRELYEHLTPTHRSSVLGGLDLIVARLETSDYSTKDLSKIKDLVYDGKTAKLIRIKAGLSQTQLSEEIGLSQSTISRCEEKGITPGFYPRRPYHLVMKYVEWLKGHE